MEGLLSLLVIAVLAYGAWRFFAGRSGKETVKVLGTIEGPGKFECEVIGESHYQENLEHVAGGRTENGANIQKSAILALEDENPHDSNAVCVRIDGFRVGYLPRAMAKSYRTRIKSQNLPTGHYYCKAVIVGGWDRGGRDRGHFGVRLDLPMEEQ